MCSFYERTKLKGFGRFLLNKKTKIPILQKKKRNDCK